MASETDHEASFLEQLINSRNRDLSFFLPFVLGFSSSRTRETDDPDPETEGTQDRIILINPLTQGMIVIEGSANLEALIREAASKQGPPPASKASIEAMQRVVITEEEAEEECSICLEGWEIGGEAREMPCKHKYHWNCIEKWLGINGSCPVCRFKMPVEEVELKKRSGGSDGEEGERRRRAERELWVSFSFSSRRDSAAAASDSDSASSSPRTQPDMSFDSEENS